MCNSANKTEETLSDYVWISDSGLDVRDPCCTKWVSFIDRPAEIFQAKYLQPADKH